MVKTFKKSGFNNIPKENKKHIKFKHRTKYTPDGVKLHKSSERTE